MRTFGQLGRSPLSGPPAPSLGVASAFRAQPTVAPVPNNVPAGAQTGAPPRVQFFSRLVAPSTLLRPTLIASGSPENRVVVITPPNVMFSIFIGDAGVTPLTGYALPSGAFEVPLVGLQELWAVTDSPVYLRVQGLISIVLMAEQARPVGRIANGGV